MAFEILLLQVIPRDNKNNKKNPLATGLLDCLGGSRRTADKVTRQVACDPPRLECHNKLFTMKQFTLP